MKDTLDEIFVDNRLKIKDIRGPKGYWKSENVSMKFIIWLNEWGDCEPKHLKGSTESLYNSVFRKGYHQAIKDVHNFLRMEFEKIDKRKNNKFGKNDVKGGLSE